ncbi:Putative serine/threonine-protein kinase-like protein CCR3 [Linum perenne]
MTVNFTPFAFLLLTAVVSSLASASTVAVTQTNPPTVCGIVAGQPTNYIQCFHYGQSTSIQPINLSFESISGGLTFFCGLVSGGLSLLCWDIDDAGYYSSFNPKRIYHSDTIALTDLTLGSSDQVCAREVDSGIAKCWRGLGFPDPDPDLSFSTITAGSGFACGILANDSTVRCWGNDSIIQSQFEDLKMESLVAAKSHAHACGFTNSGDLVCKGANESGQLEVPANSTSFEFSGVAAGLDFNCAIREKNGLLTCWGRGVNRVGLNVSGVVGDSFESVVVSSDFVCGLTTGNLTVTCWGTGWTDFDGNPVELPLGTVIPGPCVQSSCTDCGLYPNSGMLCSGSGNICKSCPFQLPVAVPLPPILNSPPPTSSPPFEGSEWNQLPVAIVVLGSVGTFAGLCSIAFFIAGLVRRRYKNSVQPSIRTAAAADIPAIPLSWRQRSGSSSKYTEYRTENFSLSELAVATDDFSPDNKVGTGSFGVVYRGKLADGREVAIKRGEATTRIKKLKEKESAFDSELALLSRLHHKHLVGLIGFCEEFNEHLLIYDYMTNGALYDHLHRQNDDDDRSSTGVILNSWKMRIKIALDASRGIEYLHNYAVPPIIHRDIKSSNILLDSNWTARVSDFGLSLMDPETDGGQHFMSTKAVGTVGYIDPEYYVSNVLTTKSDIYGLGVVLLELLTGKKAVFRNGEDGGGPIGIVEFAAPLILAGEMEAVLDKRVGMPRSYEAEAVEIMAGLAAECVNLEGVERPEIVEVVANLERAFGLCQEFQATFSTGSLSSD